MWGTVMAIVVAATILGTSMDAFAMAGGSSRKRGGGGGGGGETYSGGGEASYSSFSEQGTWENGSNGSYAAAEPGTLILLASGAAGLALWARRRK